jgi:hypothetical protein
VRARGEGKGAFHGDHEQEDAAAMRAPAFSIAAARKSAISVLASSPIIPLAQMFAPGDHVLSYESKPQRKMSKRNDAAG